MALSSKLGHFNLLEEIAHGGMGTVFRAFDPTLNREVAIKVLRENFARDPKFLNDFLQEARSAAAISHPHIVQVYFVGEESGQYYIVMELLRGRTLREIIERDGPMDEERALDVGIEVVEGRRVTRCGGDTEIVWRYGGVSCGTPSECSSPLTKCATADA